MHDPGSFELFDALGAAQVLQNVVLFHRPDRLKRWGLQELFPHFFHFSWSVELKDIL